jgi:hypothetical protein
MFTIFEYTVKVYVYYCCISAYTGSTFVLYLDEY